MADLSPNLSPYAALAKSGQSGVGAMDPSALLGLIQKSRELQTQNAVSDALRASGGDPNVALRSLMQPGAPGIATAGMVSDLTRAAGAKADLQRGYFNDMADIATSVLGSGKPITDDVIHNLSVEMAQRGVPADVATDFINSMPPDQKGRQAKITQLQNLRAGGATPDVVWRQTPQGLVPESGAAVRQGLYNPPDEESTQAAPGGPPPTQARTLPIGAEESYATSGQNAQKLQDRAPAISAQRSLLAQMRSELEDAETGGPALAGLRMHINQTLSGLGLPGIDPEGKQTATQLFNKFSYQLQQQQAGAWPTEKNLGSVFSANPSIALTKLGNSGVLAFLQGNMDTENLVLSQWNKWKAAHGGGPETNNLFRDWLNDTLPTQYGRGFNARPGEAPGSGGIRNFDPRVLQYEHLNDDEKRQFVKGMNAKDKQTFANNVNRYDKANYVTEVQQ